VNAPAGPEAPRRPAGVLFGAALLALCAVGGFLLYHATHPAHPTLYPQAPAASISQGTEGTPPVTGSAPAPARRIPEELPPVTLPGPDGVPRSLADFRGRLLVVNFWATWCEPCRREIPLLQRLRRERAKDGVEIVGIALDHRDEVAKYAADRGIAYPLLIGETGGLEAVSALGMDTVLPFSVFADRTGRIVTLKVGELRPDEATLILDRLTDLDRGRLTLAQAREQISTGMARLHAPIPAPGAPSRN
jgi:thiol-disulfide isomerase/thioredoxin